MSRPPSAYTPSSGSRPLPSDDSHYTRYPSEARAHQHPPSHPVPRHHPSQEPGPSGRYYPPTPTTTSGSQVFAFRPPPPPAYSSRHSFSASSAYASGSTPRAGTSPTRHPAPYSQPPGRGYHEQDNGNDDASSGEEGSLGEKQKLEVKREKNRLKQRNLRVRRANHVTTLETSLETLEKKYKLLEEQHEEAQQRGSGLEKYAVSLEDILLQHGLESELAQARTALESAGHSRPALTAPGQEGANGRSKKRRKGDDNAEEDDTAAGSELAYQLGTQHTETYSSFVQPTPPRQPPRPRTSTSSFAPLVLDSNQTSHFISAPSPRSIRIEDLLSPSFTQDTATMPAMQPLGPLISSASHRNPISLGQGGVAMSAQGSADSLGSRADVKSEATSAPGEHSATSLPDWYFYQAPPLPLPAPPPINTIASPPIHPSVHTARVLLRMLLADQAHLPISQCTLPTLIPSQQTILLNAIYNLTTPAFRDQVNEDQIQNMPPVLMKLLLGYSHSSTADLRVILMPIAILRARVVGFIKEQLPFDVTAFISHVLADGRIYGDTADPDAWEMSQTFWDVWGGWFKAGRKYCASMSGWRRRFGHQGATVIEILLGMEGEHSRMSQLIGHPEGWKKPVIVSPDRDMVVEVNLR